MAKNYNIQSQSEPRIELMIANNGKHLNVEPLTVKGLFVLARLSSSNEHINQKMSLPSTSMALACILSGTVKLYCGMSEYEYSKSDLLFINGNSIFDSYSVSDDFSAYAILFGKKFVEYMERNTALSAKEVHETDSFFKLVCPPQVNAILCQQFENLASFSNLDEQSDSLNSFVVFHAASLINSIFILGRKTSKEQCHPTKPHYIYSRYLKLINEYLSYRYNINFYAKKLNITPKYLSVTTKAVTGRNALELRDDLLLNKAKQMLNSTDMSMLEISEKLGFDSQSNFARFFKKMENITPSQYKRNK